MPVPKVLREAMEHATLSFNGQTGIDINSGKCFEWASIVFDLVEGSKIAGHNVGGHGHSYIEYEGRCYDAECPRGVLYWDNLPFFNRAAR
jgi:hypothetical protein